MSRLTNQVSVDLKKATKSKKSSKTKTKTKKGTVPRCRAVTRRKAASSESDESYKAQYTTKYGSQ